MKKEDYAKIVEFIEKSENPLVFYDDDPDGVCSYLLLKRKYNKIKGIIVKSTPQLKEEYARKVDELCPDLVIVLDKPIIEQDFIDKVNVPIVWIDHHPVVKRMGVHYFNPKVYDVKNTLCTTEIIAKINPEPLWVAGVGAVGDWQIPAYFDKMLKEYPDLLKKTDNPPVILYETEFGRLVKIVSFLLKDTTSQIRKNVSILEKINSPYEILRGETSQGKYLLKQIEKNEKEYNKLIEKAKQVVTKDEILYFEYPSTKNSYTSDLSNELQHLFPDKMIIVGRTKGDQVKLSFRCATRIVPVLLEKALTGVKGYGGGHEHACGGAVEEEDFGTFMDNLRGEMQKD